MKKQKLFANQDRVSILQELEASPKKFVELKKVLNSESNILSYNLNILKKENIIQKDNFYFKLTRSGRNLMPYVRKANDASSLPLSCVATIVRDNGNILIRKKIKEPEKGKSIFIGGKMELGESIFDACKRHVKEKVDIDVKNLKVICINNYVSKRDRTTSHFVVFFVTCNPIGKPKDAVWKDPNKIRGKMFPDNKFVIQNMLDNRKIKVINSIYNETKDEFKVVNIS